MKIVVDKVECNPAHSISRQEVKAIFAGVPEEWKSGVERIRLANGSRRRLPVWLVGGEMTILSRGLSKRFVVDEILIQLAKHALGLRRGLGQLTKADRIKLTAMVQPVLPGVWKQINDVASVRKVIEYKLNGGE